MKARYIDAKATRRARLRARAAQIEDAAYRLEFEVAWFTRVLEAGVPEVSLVDDKPEADVAAHLEDVRERAVEARAEARRIGATAGTTDAERRETHRRFLADGVPHPQQEGGAYLVQPWIMRAELAIANAEADRDLAADDDERSEIERRRKAWDLGRAYAMELLATMKAPPKISAGKRAPARKAPTKRRR